jgi:hypothetical protein
MYFLFLLEIVNLLVSMADLINEYYPNHWRSTFINYIRPVCTQCPPHAECHPHLEMICNDGFIYKPHPFQLNGLLPIIGECVLDTEKHHIAIITEHALSILHDKDTCVECEAELPMGMMEQEMQAEVLKYKSGKLSAQDFDVLFEVGIGEIEKRGEFAVAVAENAGPGSKYACHQPLFIFQDINQLIE